MGKRGKVEAVSSEEELEEGEVRDAVGPSKRRKRERRVWIDEEAGTKAKRCRHAKTQTRAHHFSDAQPTARASPPPKPQGKEAGGSGDAETEAVKPSSGAPEGGAGEAVEEKSRTELEIELARLGLGLLVAFQAAGLPPGPHSHAALQHLAALRGILRSLPHPAKDH